MALGTARSPLLLQTSSLSLLRLNQRKVTEKIHTPQLFPCDWGTNISNFRNLNCNIRNFFHLILPDMRTQFRYLINYVDWGIQTKYTRFSLSGFYISFDDDAPVKPKPPLRTKKFTRKTSSSSQPTTPLSTPSREDADFPMTQVIYSLSLYIGVFS